MFFPPGCETTLLDEQREFFHEVKDPDGEFVSGRVEVERTSDFKSPVTLTIVGGTPERKFLRELTRPENAKEMDAWLKNTPVGFYAIEYAWKRGEHPKRGEFSADFFVKQAGRVFVVEVKDDDEIVNASPENIKKHEYATQHFNRLNEWLKKERVRTRYQFNMVSPKSFNVFFQKLRDRELVDFRSEVDVTMKKAGKMIN